MLAGACGLPAAAAERFAPLAALAIPGLLEVCVPLDVLQETLLEDEPLEHPQCRLDPSTVDHNGQRLSAARVPVTVGCSPLALGRRLFTDSHAACPSMCS